MLDFTGPGYVKLLARLKDGRAFPTFGELRGKAVPERFVLLRHDVDYSPATALALAELEAREGVRSTYFFLMSSPYYNLLSAEHCRAPARIAALGHEIGLHYDVEALLAQVENGDPTPALHREAELLGSITGKKVISIACHNPSLLKQNPLAGTPPYQDAYEPRLISEIPYYSDSARAWRDNAVQALTAEALPPRLQLLIHPVLWTTNAPTRWEWLKAFFGERVKALGADQERTRLIWVDHSGVREHDRRVDGQDPSKS